MADETENAPTALTANILNRTGYTFSGWNTAANGSGTSYADGAIYPFTTSITLYAQWTANSPTVPGPTVPGAPTGLTVTAGNGQASFTWNPPSSNGGTVITGYTVTCWPFGSVTTSNTNATITGLTDGITYTCSVTAENSVGTGPSSSSVNVTPEPVPLALNKPCSDYRGNAAFICWAYEDLLGRAPDRSGLTSWGAHLVNGMSRTMVAYHITISHEYRHDLVTGYYKTFLKRTPDSKGLSYWIARLYGGASDQTVMMGLLSSNEFYADSGATPSGFVTALYSKLLGRVPDSKGLAFWVGKLSSGTTRSAIVSGFLFSTEYRSDFIRIQYRHLLNRNADAKGFSYWLAQLVGGASNEFVIAHFVGSPEFYADATRA
jgi:uncharacterized repeat protein (TIGR02543 family)